MNILSIRFFKFLMRVFCIFFFFYLLQLVALVYAVEIQKVEVMGVARIKRGYVGCAKRKAIENALREAVEKVVGTYVSSDTLVNNFQIVRDRIYTRAKGYVKTYKIIRGYVRKGNYYVKLRAWVKNGDIENDLDALHLLMGRKGNPRVGVVFETALYGNNRFATCDNLAKIAADILGNKLLERGFPVVDFNVVSDFNDRKLLEMGNKIGVDIVVVGNLEIVKDKVMYKGIDVVVNQILSTIKAVRLDTGEVIANVSGSDKEPGIDTLECSKVLLDRLFNNMSQRLVREISGVWSKEVQRGSTLTFFVANLGSFSKFQRFKQYLVVNVPGVKDVKAQDYSVMYGIYLVTFDGTVQRFASELYGEIFDGGKLMITKTSKNSLYAKIVY